MFKIIIKKHDKQQQTKSYILTYNFLIIHINRSSVFKYICLTENSLQQTLKVNFKNTK